MESSLSGTGNRALLGKGIGIETEAEMIQRFSCAIGEPNGFLHGKRRVFLLPDRLHLIVVAAVRVPCQD